MRSWLVIPAMAVASGAAAVALGATPALAATGAALAACVRVLAGDAPAALTGAAIAPLLAVASLAGGGAGGGTDVAREAIALAAAGWAIVELARLPGEATSPLVAALPAAVAGLLDPRFVALIAIAGLRVMSAPWRPRSPRWVLSLPVAGLVAVALAVLGGTAWPRLGVAWFGAAAHPAAPAALAAAGADALGPLTAVAALAGLGVLGALGALGTGGAPVRPRWPALALASVILGAGLADLRQGSVSPATIGLAALLAGLAISRLAGMIRVASGQAVVGATVGALVLVPPVWTAVAHRAPPAHIGRSSR
ncbi:MAG TPA: hypothetical protein VFT22_21885 [Kofleriaceae bacterium]|nr:hypothetical protein [Kofleriaceae bacterium]